MTTEQNRPSAPMAAPPRPSGSRPIVSQVPDRRQAFGMRNRADSTGSTRGAFGPEAKHPTKERSKPQQPPVPSGAPPKYGGVDSSEQPPAGNAVVTKKTKKKKSKKSRENPAPYVPPPQQNLSLADIASEAMTEIGATDGTGAFAGALNHKPLPPHPLSIREERDEDMISPVPTRQQVGADRSALVTVPSGDSHDPMPGQPQRRTHVNQSSATLQGAAYLDSDAASSWLAADQNQPMPQAPAGGVPYDASIPQGYQNGSGPYPPPHMVSPYAPPSHHHRSYPPTIGATLSYLWQQIVYHIGPSNLFYEPAEDEEPPKDKSYFKQFLHEIVYDPWDPEFSSLQQFTWAVFIGIFMGFFTAYWGMAIEFCVEIMWKELPEQLLEWGVFTELDGPFPLVHYMWICPAIFGGILAYISAIVPDPIPGQNEWIDSVHRIGVMDHKTFFNLILISTGGMASGLSLGPELPLVLTAGMVGSYLALLTRQSILSARVMNLTAAGAAIGGFFGFPMAGALFVLEIPHQMGLQYFEALSPATIASIVAVLVNRMVTGNDVTGYFNYPFMTATLPSHIFYIAILYGLVGSAVGVLYSKGCIFLKGWVHDWFHFHEHHDEEHGESKENEGAKALEEGKANGNHGETVPLVGGPELVEVTKPKKGIVSKIQSCFKAITGCYIKHEPTRAAVAGVIAGIICGVICIFLPHDLFWGEAQLQTLIDKGRTPLPVFGQDDEPTAALTAYGYCMIDPEDEEAVAAGFGVICSGAITLSKIITIGLSLGTGIVGGHFWGPLFVGAAASNFFTDLMAIISRLTGFGGQFSAYPCVAILCIMGSTHVVTFRAHMAIMLILTLTISAFEPEGGDNLTGGDYSAVFPLLVVSCFISLMLTRKVVFYKKQCCRGDIIASPEVLCEPKKEGMPEYVHYGDDEFDDGSYDSYEGSSVGDSSFSSGFDDDDDDYEMTDGQKVASSEETSQEIERAFLEKQRQSRSAFRDDSTRQTDLTVSTTSANTSTKSPDELTPPSRLDELLDKPLDSGNRSAKKHRRIKSGGDLSTNSNASYGNGSTPRTRSNSADRSKRKSHNRTTSVGSSASASNRERSGSAGRAGTPTQGVLMRVSSFGEINEPQPALMAQARRRSASVTKKTPPVPKPQSGRHSRKSSRDLSQSAALAASDVAGALSTEEIERSFASVMNQTNLSESQRSVSSENRF